MTTSLERPQAGDAGSSSAPSLLAPRPPRSRLWRRLLGAVVVLVTVAAALGVPLSMGVLPSVYQPPLPEGAALAVGDEVLTVAEYDERVRALESLYGAQQPGDPAGRDRYRRDAAKSVASQMVLNQQIDARGIVIPEPRLREQLNGMVEAQFGKGPQGYQQFMEGLRQAGSSEPEMLNEIRQQMAMTELVTQVTNEVPEPADEELPAEFPKYAERFGVPEQRRLANIVVPSREQAQGLIDQLRSGIPFADLARRVSIDPATRDKGGDFGQPITKDKLQPAYGDAAFSVPQGQVYGPVQSAEGWNVGQALQVIPGKPASYDESIIPLKAAVHNQRKFDHWKQWFEQRLADAHVRYADAYRPADPVGAPAALDAVDPSGAAPAQAPPAPQGQAPQGQAPQGQAPAAPQQQPAPAAPAAPGPPR